jgi:dipeptidyl aminopeptidase/acylaminoacyl peptidase
MVEHVKASPDKKFLYFSTNHQLADPLDLDRRHVGRVNLLAPKGVERLTQGKGLEWMPVVTGDNQTLACFAATHQMAPVFSIQSLSRADAPLEQVGAVLQEPGLPNDFVVPQKVTFKAADGTLVHADWFKAKGAGKKPALVYVHGGPPRQMLLGWHYSDYYSNAYAANQYLVSLGFHVLVVNYRLGIGYGEAFHRPQGGGALGAKEYQDIQAAGKWLQQNLDTDPARIGIYGGSYGGYLTAMALARDSKVFKAGVDIHGVHDQTLSNGLVAAGEKWEKAPDFALAQQTAWSSSPIAYLSTWTSPVLVIHGDDDRNVRVSQSTDLVRRLEQKKIPHETLLVPDDTHHWMRHSNAILVYQATADFFVRQFLK